MNDGAWAAIVLVALIVLAVVMVWYEVSNAFDVELPDDDDDLPPPPPFYLL